MRSRTWERSVERLERLARSGSEPDTVRLEAIEILRHAIGFSMWGFPLVDPETLIPYRPLVSHPPPWGSRLPERWVLDQDSREINDRGALARQKDHVGLLSASTGGDLARCRRWRELGRPVGMGDELRAAIVDHHWCWGSFELFRASDDPPFDDDDAALVRRAAASLSTVVRKCSMQGAPRLHQAPYETGVLLMSDDLRPKGSTGAAAAWLDLLRTEAHAEPTRFPIVVYATVGRLLAIEAGQEPQRAARVRVRMGQGDWAVIEASRLDQGRVIAIALRAARPAEVLDLFGRAHGLTARERELLRLVAAGLDTGRIASRLFISTYTAKDHLKSIFEKTGIRSRRELLAAMLGHSAGSPN